jgi:DNA-directed RNA polymerase subunit M/transcription elongation factor TFIIS
MSKIQKIFDADSDDSETEYSDSEQSCDDACEEELDDYIDEDDFEDEKDEEVEEEEQEDEKDEPEDDEKEEEDDDEIDEEEVDDEEQEEDEEEVEDEENEIDFDDFDDGEFEKENEIVDVEKADKTVIKKSKNFLNLMRVHAVQQRQKCVEHANIREDGKKFLYKLFQGQSNEKIERLEKCLYNFCCRKNKEINTKDFKRCYSFELYSVMSNLKNKKTLNDIKDYYLEDIDHFERGTYEKEVIEDNKKLKLITHVSEPVAGIHKCRCGCDKIYSYELQTRSGDEGMTVFLQCYDCGRKWRL